MRLFTTLAVTIAVSLGALSAADAQEWGDLKIKFVYKGTAKAPQKISPNRDQAFCGKHDILDETLVVGKDGGIKNLVVYAYEGRGGVELPAIHPEAKGDSKTHVLANKGCRFEPHIVLCQTGDQLKVTNPDGVGHNANLNFLVNTAQNITIPPGGEKVVELESAEPAPIPVECNIHPWMQAKVVVLDHPYAAASADDGTLTIKNLPVGKVALRVYHEGARRLSGLKIGDGELDRRNVIEVEIKAGANDLGVVEVPESMF